MDFSFFITNLILILISITIVVTLIISAIISISILTDKSSDILSYYIKNMCYSVFCAVAYIVFFILFLYGLRIWNLGSTLDMRIFYAYIVQFFQLPLFFCISAIILSFFVGINILLFIFRIHKYCIHHIFILYLYVRYTSFWDAKWFFNKLSEPFSNNILTHFLHKFLFSINDYLLRDRMFNGLNWYSSRAKIPWYFFPYHINKFISKFTYNKYFESFLTCSPLLVIFYDCAFNDFILRHIYYYLLLYIPIILWRRVTTCMFTDASYICELLCNIYYNKETCIYAILSSHKKILDSYILTGLRSDIDLGLEVEMYLNSSLCFAPDTAVYNLYCNNEGVLLERTRENKLIRKILDEPVLEEEWLLIIDKHHFINNNFYKTLVYISV